MRSTETGRDNRWSNRIARRTSVRPSWVVAYYRAPSTCLRFRALSHAAIRPSVCLSHAFSATTVHYRATVSTEH